MQANDLLKYRDKTIDGFKDGTFLSEHWKKTDDAAYDYGSKDVDDFIQEIKSMSEKINLNLIEEFFEAPSPADYAKMLIYIKNPHKNKEIVTEKNGRISDLKRQNKINEWNTNKNIEKNAVRH